MEYLIAWHGVVGAEAPSIADAKDICREIMGDDVTFHYVHATGGYNVVADGKVIGELRPVD